jgi:O-antigen ligase
MNQPQTSLNTQYSRVRRDIFVATLEAMFQNTGLLFVAFFAHAILGIALKVSGSSFDNLYIFGVFGVGLFFALSRHIPLKYTLYIVAYIAGAEVLFRMTNSGAFWSGASFATIALCIIAVLVRKQMKAPPIGLLLYIACLLPSLVLTISISDRSRDLISSYFAVPAALICLGMFMNNLNLSRTELRDTLLMIALPVAGIAGIIFTNLETLELTWTQQSNNQVAGFGANQVSTALGLGAFALFVVGLYLANGSLIRWGAFAIAIIYIILAFYTFARGGIFNTALALLILIGHNLIRGKNRLANLALVSIAIIILVIIFPRLDETTNDQLTARYTDLDTTGRSELAIEDIKLFLEEPLTGVGLGLSPQQRPRMNGFRVAPHTEYTRMLAEHGILGLFAIFALFGVAVQNYLKQTTHQARGIAASFIVWAAFYLTHSAMRTVAPAFMLGITCAQLSTDDDAADAN